jgi:hypothetical protein
LIILSCCSSQGWSLPLYLFEKTLNAKLITVPVVNYDNNQHAENENVQLKFLLEGIETIRCHIW